MSLSFNMFNKTYTKHLKKNHVNLPKKLLVQNINLKSFFFFLSTATKDIPNVNFLNFLIDGLPSITL